MHKEIFLDESFYTAIGLKGLDAFYGQGVVLISQDSITKINDLSFEQSTLAKLDDDDFIETIHEFHGRRALLLLYSNGSVKLLTEDKDNGKITI